MEKEDKNRIEKIKKAKDVLKEKQKAIDDKKIIRK